MRIVLLHGLLTTPVPPGNDTGGAVAQLVAAYHPERISGLVSPTATPTSASSRRSSARFSTPRACPAASRRSPRRCACRPPAGSRSPTAPRLREFDKPVTHAWAREDRLVFPPSIAERLAADFPRARISGSTTR
jgi:pimeloyl-ACP methyl ester carboxylesterase